jgi:regulator of protease activity HflC (stomatin/prohibitin superfamily)
MDWLIPIAILIAMIALVTAGLISTMRFFAKTIIYAPAIGLHYRDGRFVGLLPPGRHAIFDPLKRTKIVPVSTVQWPATSEVSVVSSDQFAFKLLLAPALSVTDPQLFHESQPAVAPDAYVIPGHEHVFIQRQIAAAAIAVVARMKLPDILADAAILPRAIEAALEGQTPGIKIDQMLVTAINLPPETRKMFTDVERARLEALAGIERARGEQAAMRVLANAARSMTDNPALANLRLLKAIETSKGPTTIVFGAPPIGMSVS